MNAMPSGAEVRNLQPVHQEVVAVECEQRVEVEERVEVPGERELERDRGASSGTTRPTSCEAPARTSDAAGPDAVVMRRARRPAIHTSVVSTNARRDAEVEEDAGGWHLSSSVLRCRARGRARGQTRHSALIAEQHEPAERVGVVRDERRLRASGPRDHEDAEARAGRPVTSSTAAGAVNSNRPPKRWRNVTNPSTSPSTIRWPRAAASMSVTDAGRRAAAAVAARADGTRRAAARRACGWPARSATTACHLFGGEPPGDAGELAHERGDRTRCRPSDGRARPRRA